MYSVLSEEAKAAFLKSRETLKWGSYGKEGGQPRQDILVKDLSDLHIENILTTQHHISGTYIEVVFLTEVEYRKTKGITVKD